METDQAQVAHDAPSYPLWPVILAGLAWLGGIGFLAAMVVLRLRTDPF